MRVLIIGGPHAGQVHEVVNGRRSLTLIDPGQMKPVSYHPNLVIPEVNIDATTYRIHRAEMRCEDQDQTYHVGLPLGDNTQPMMALLHYAVGRCYDNPTNS